jgi:hypothetical protein
MSITCVQVLVWHGPRAQRLMGPALHISMHTSFWPLTLPRPGRWVLITRACRLRGGFMGHRSLPFDSKTSLHFQAAPGAWMPDLVPSTHFSIHWYCIGGEVAPTRSHHEAWAEAQVRGPCFTVCFSSLSQPMYHLGAPRIEKKGVPEVSPEKG